MGKVSLRSGGPVSRRTEWEKLTDFHTNDKGISLQHQEAGLREKPTDF